ncbi:hypothetical protein SLE2022_281220 [Rubroshorea leprosula]
MVTCLRKLLRKSPPTKAISALRNPQALNPTPLPILQPQIHCSEPRANHGQTSYYLPLLLGTFKADDLTPSTHSQSSVFYPGFGLISDPISLPGSIRSEPDDDVSGGSGTIWADSVKKKRKKKMNKHKYNKLRKRLRRKT